MKSGIFHCFATDYESAEGLTWTVEEDDILCDVKRLLSEYYLATFNADGKALNISFNNGQKFCLSVQETTEKSA